MFWKLLLMMTILAIVAGNLRAAGVENSAVEQTSRVRIAITFAAQDVMRSTGIELRGDQLILHKDASMRGQALDLYDSGKNARIEIEQAGTEVVLLRCIEKSGTVYEYRIFGGIFDPNSKVTK